MKTSRLFWLVSFAVVAWALLIPSSLMAAQASLASDEGIPPSEVIDYVIHNKGNIVTTIFNWGLMGYFSDVPRGEWPKGSGRNYLAEIKYWMGATLPSGDTVVVDTDDDFMPESNFASADGDYRIRLSTDTARFEYDRADTVGLGNHRPAYGWRNFDLQTNAWEYDQIYNPIDRTFFSGGPIAIQESQYVMNDARLGHPGLGLRITQTVYQWNYKYNEDYIFVVLNIKNTSENDYTDFAFGLYCDFDIGGYYQGENGRLDDVVAYDTTENLAWTYDQDDYDPGWGASVVAGRMGTKYIETPGNLGMTAFRTDQWENLPETDEGKFALISSQQFDAPLPPADQFYLQCTRGIDLRSGQVVRVVYALVAGQTDQRLIETSRMAQLVYDNYFTGPEPPRQPVLKAVPGDKLTKLFWNNAAESSVDPLSGLRDFVGYKLYRSSNFGYTWGELTFNEDGSRGPDYVPIANFRKDESGLISHTYIDTALINGFEYWYAISAFDEGNPTIPIEPLQSAKGRPGEDSCAAQAIPRTNPAGYFPIQQTVQHLFSGIGSGSEGSIAVELYDQGAFTGHDYKVVFSEDPLQTYWHLLDNVTGDTILADQTQQNFAVSTAPLTDGFQLVVLNGERVPRSLAQTGFSSADTTVRLGRYYGISTELTGYPTGGDLNFRSTYEIRFTQAGSIGYWWWDDVTPMSLPFEVWNTSLGEQVIAEIRDVNFDQVWDPQTGEHIIIVNSPYDGSPHPEAFPWEHTWLFNFDTLFYGQTGDVFTISGAPLNSALDEFHFSAPGVDPNLASQDLDKIKVVPNPYIAHAEWEHEAGQRKIEFTHLPDRATIRIYTLAGDLVCTLPHNDGSGTASWNLLSVNEQSVAPGVYYYHVESPYGERIGKFAIIK